MRPTHVTMSHHSRPFLHFVLLLAIGLRTVFGAPCCLPPVEAAPMEQGVDHSAHAHHDMAEQNGGDPGGDAEGHSGHGDDPSANPCCSACGPTLPSEPTSFTLRDPVREVPAPAPIRELATRPPFPAYDARGPPRLI